MPTTLLSYSLSLLCFDTRVMPYQSPCCLNHYLCCALIFMSCCINNFIVIIIIFVVLRFSWHYHIYATHTALDIMFIFSFVRPLHSAEYLNVITFCHKSRPWLWLFPFWETPHTSPTSTFIRPPLTIHHLSTTLHPPPSGMGWCQVGGPHCPRIVSTRKACHSEFFQHFWLFVTKIRNPMLANKFHKGAKPKPRPKEEIPVCLEKLLLEAFFNYWLHLCWHSLRCCRI